MYIWPTPVVSSEVSFCLRPSVCLQSPGCILSRHKFSLISGPPTQAHGNSGIGLLSAGVGREVAEAHLGLCPSQLHSNTRQPSLCSGSAHKLPLHPAPLNCTSWSTCGFLCCVLHQCSPALTQCSRNGLGFPSACPSALLTLPVFAARCSLHLSFPFTSAHGCLR